MRRADFESMIRDMSRDVPPEFMDGIDGIDVTGKTIPHPLRADVYTMGECEPHAFGPEESARLRSRVLLHYGSFAALARITPGFDWRKEAWETLTHELRHHLEWRARVPDLEALDDAVEANYARHDGEAFPPLFFLDGETMAEGVFKVEDDVFLDVPLTAKEWKAQQGAARVFQWHGKSWRVAVPKNPADVLFLTIEGVDPEPAGELVLVIRRRPGARDLWHRAVVGHGEARVTTAPSP